MKTRLLASSACIAFATSFPGLALSQEAEPDTEASRALDVVVVTAQKREQDILDVGATVSAIGEQTLRDSRVNTMSDLPAHVPNVDIRNQAAGTLPVITIRGVGLNDFSNTNNPSAGVYIDGVYLSSLGLLSFDFFDLERVEVLKGPQGTLYGRNSTAGAINFISAKPVFDDVSTTVSATYGNYGTQELQGVSNLPVNDQFAIRLGGKLIRQTEGFFYNRTTGSDLGEQSIFLGRAQLRWRPDSNTDVTLKIDGFDNDSELGQGAFFGALDFTNPPGFACAALARGETDPNCTNALGYSDPDGDPFRGDWAEAPFYDAGQIAATLEGTFNLGGAELASVTGYIDHYREAYTDLDASPATLLEFVPTTDVEQYSQEFRLSGTQNGRLDWLLGVFGSHDRIKVGSTGYADDFFGTRTSGYGDQTTDAAAVFGHGEYALTDQISLIGGLRFSWEKKEYSARVFDDNPFGSSCLLSATCTPGMTGRVTLASADDLEVEDENVSWKVGLDWKPSDNTLYYASVSQGVKSGGFFFGFTTNSGSFQPFDPESLISYEVGMKNRTADGALQFAASAFYYDYSDIQTYVRDESGTVPFQRLGNVGEATLYGADFEATFMPPAIDGLSITGGLGLLESELGSFVALGGPVEEGKEFPNAPALTVNATVRYERPVGNNLRGIVQVDGRYSGETQKDALNNPVIAADAYNLWNGRLAIAAEDNRWEFALWGKNLFDEAYKVQGVDLTSLGFGYENYNPPRTYGATLTVRF